MKWLPETAFFLPVILSCLSRHTPDKKPVIETENPLSVQADSLINEDKDGVAVENPVLSETEKMPPALTAELNRKYPGWKLPEVAKGYYEMQDFRTAQGPVWIRGDFNGDRKEDFAAKIQLKDSVYIIALLKHQSHFRPYFLKKDKLHTLQNQEKGSIYYLTFSAKNDTVYNYETEKKQILPSDAINIGVDYSAGTYYFGASGLVQIFTGD